MEQNMIVFEHSKIERNEVKSKEKAATTKKLNFFNGIE